jgi:serine/threonine-protein kinase
MTDVTFRARQVAYLLAAIAATAGAAFLARRNWRSGRADRRGAFRIAGYVLVCHVAAWLFGADHVPSLEGEWRIVREAVGIGLVEAGQIWLFYLGLEPFVRRRWPETLISWSRLLAGRWRDPLVGRHVLFGLLFAVASQASVHLNALAPLALGQPPLTPRAAGITALAHWRYLPADLFAMQARAVLETVGLLFLLVLLQLVLRRRWLAVAACFALLSLYGTFWRGESFYVSLAFSMVRAAAGLWVLSRFGLLALTVCGAAFYWLSAAPLTLDLTAWYSGLTLIEAAVLVAVAAWAMRSALGGQPLFAHRLLED